MHNPDTPDRCTATARTTGERCKNAPIKGATVCRMHGGSAGQVQKKAQERLDEMADSVTADMQAKVEDFLDLYEDADTEEKLALMREARQLWTEILDRTGHGPKETRELSSDDDSPLMILERDGDDD